MILIFLIMELFQRQVMFLIWFIVTMNVFRGFPLIMYYVMINSMKNPLINFQETKDISCFFVH